MNSEEEVDRVLVGTKEEAIDDIGTLTGTARVECGGITIALEEVTEMPVTLLSRLTFIVRIRSWCSIDII